MNAFIGIDLAFAKKKRLPVALCVWDNGRLVPLPVASKAAPEAPRGAGNPGTLHAATVREFAEDTAAYLRALERHFGVVIRRVAIDAPSDPKPSGLARRHSESELDRRRISCFTTPSVSEFLVIRNRAAEHLAKGGAVSRLPHANQLWMLVGFELFARLRSDWECLEVFPQATAAALGVGGVHKSRPGGVRAQLAAVAAHTRWPAAITDKPFRGLVWGPSHDGLDAYLSAWVASLARAHRVPLGGAPDDSIWLPRVATAV